jgi:hypothetical protein
MRFAPSSSGSRFRSCFALLALGISACGSSNKPKLETGMDAGSDVKSDTASDTRGDVKADTRADVRPDLPPVDVGNPLCEGTEPTNDFIDPFVILDFNDSTASPFTSANSNGKVGSGGVYTTMQDYPTSDFSAQNWHLTATVLPTTDIQPSAHFGIYWQCLLTTASGGCTLDASRFKGISFKVKGYAGSDHQMTLSLGRAENDTSIQNAGCGSCVLPTGSDASAGDYCRGPRTNFTVPADGSEATVTLLWTDFTGGSPHASIDPHQLTGILFVFHDPVVPDGGTGGIDAPVDAPMSTDDGGLCSDDGGVCDAGAPETGTGSDDGGADDASTGPSYNADITIDDITLVPF